MALLGSPPRIFDIVTGFFPETSPKETWATNPRPLLVCGVAKQANTGLFLCRVAYGTSKIHKAKDDDLTIGNLSMLNELELKKPTTFVIHSGQQIVILPWLPEFFRPWSGRSSPILSRLSNDMQLHVGFILSDLDDLPSF